MDLERQLDQIKAEIAQIRAQLDERYQISVTGLLDRLERNGQVVVQVPEEARAVVAEGGSDEESIHVEEDLEDLCIKPSMLENLELIEEWVQRLSEAKQAGAPRKSTRLLFSMWRSRRGTTRLRPSAPTLRSLFARFEHHCAAQSDLPRGFRDLRPGKRPLQGWLPEAAGGGRAQLVLTDEDMFETGVDIEVSLPVSGFRTCALVGGDGHDGDCTHLCALPSKAQPVLSLG